MKKMLIMVALTLMVSGCACCGICGGGCGCGGRETACSAKKCCGTCKGDKAKCIGADKAKSDTPTTGKCCGTCK